ncbi:MAG: hypothetical protein WC934_02010 [Acidithiobacillus sp.]|jgi:hypothetical protein
MSVIKKMVSLPENLIKYIEDESINLSKFIQKQLIKKIQHEKKEKKYSVIA